VNGIIIYVYSVDESALTFGKKTGKVIMEKCNIAYLVRMNEVRREQPLQQQLSAVAALLAAVPLLW
jgi:hypothetical protein